MIPKRLQAISAAFLSALVNGACSSGGDDDADAIITAGMAVNAHNDYFGSLNCYAPVDWGTNGWELLTVGPDNDCIREVIVDVQQEEGNWCLYVANQWSYKYSDAPGFNVSPIEVSRRCFNIYRSDGEIKSQFLGGTPVGSLPDWPV